MFKGAVTNHKKDILGIMLQQGAGEVCVCNVFDASPTSFECADVYQRHRG